MNKPSLLEVDNLARHYERPRTGFFSKKPIVKALNGVSFSVQRGESLGIVGESGAGKSTLARVLLALEEPTSGSVRFKGENLFDLPADRKLALRRHIQMVFQDPFETLDPKHKVLSVIGEPLALVDGVNAAERVARAETALVEVGLDAGDLEKFPHEFSGGQRQRLAIARALITKPDLIVADEPVSALNSSMRTQILDLMVDLQERFELTFIVISQDPSVIRQVANRCAVMKSGVIVEQGDTSQVFDNPRHDHTKELLDASFDIDPDEPEAERAEPAATTVPTEDGVSAATDGSQEKVEDKPGEVEKDSAKIDTPPTNDDAPATPAVRILDTPTPPPPAAQHRIDATAAIKAADIAIANAIASARSQGWKPRATAAGSAEPTATATAEDRAFEAETPPEPVEMHEKTPGLHALPASEDSPNEESGVDVEALRGSDETDLDGADLDEADLDEADLDGASAEPEPVVSISSPTSSVDMPEPTMKSGPPETAPETVVPKQAQMIQGKNLIGGRWHDASDDRLLKVINPSDGTRIGYIARGTADDIDRAVTAARRAMDGPWGRLPAFERGRMLAALARRVLEHVDHLASLEARDVGKPLRQARADAVALARYFEFYGGAADKIHGETIPYHEGYTVLTLREPHGVTGHIVPWNYPMQIIGRSVGAALAMGNACVLKPGEDASLTALEIGQLALDAGLPPGVLNIVTGLGEEAGAALAAHPGIDHLSFTGSVETGQRVQQAAASHSCPVTLELGGKSPQIVFADADLDQALPFLVNAAIQNAGQTCSAGSRVLIQDWIYDELAHRLAERFDNLDVGPAERDLDCGPVINPLQKQRIETYLKDARSERIAVLGEGEIAPDAPDGGYYVKPTLLGDVPPGHKLAQEEIFGPALCAIRFSSEDDAIRIANDSAYGLVAGIWTKDGARQMRLARAIKTGQVFINNYGAGGGVELPFGGVKSSGFGREKGFEALYGFSTLKTVAIHHG